MREEWGVLLDTMTGCTSDGRLVCMKCGAPIPVGKGVTLTDEEKKVVTQRLGPDTFFKLRLIEITLMPRFPVSEERRIGFLSTLVPDGVHEPLIGPSARWTLATLEAVIRRLTLPFDALGTRGSESQDRRARSRRLFPCTLTSDWALSPERS
jgi:hypothetical protein